MKNKSIANYMAKVKEDPQYIKKIPVQILKDNSELCLEALLKDEKMVNVIPEQVIGENETIQYMMLIIENISNIVNIPDKVMNQNPQLHKMLIKKTSGVYIPREFLINNMKFVEECLFELDLNENAIVELIIGTKNIEYVKEKIRRREEYNFSIDSIKKLVNSIENINEIEKIIDEDKKFKSYEVAAIVRSTNNVDFIKKAIQNRGKYKFTAIDLKRLIISTNDKKYIQIIVRNREFYNLKASDIRDILLKVDDKKFVEDLLRELIISKNHGFSIEDIRFLLGYINDISYIKELVQGGIIGNTRKLKKINLPIEMTVGIEIESEGRYSTQIKKMKELISNWKSEEEISLDHGVEIVSPIIQSNAHKEKEIYEVCEILNYSGQKCNDRCGGHIHIGANYLTSLCSWQNLTEIWANTEKIIYIISNKEGEEIRKDIEKWAKPISPKIQKAIEKGKVRLKDEKNVYEFCEELKLIQQYESISSINEKFTGINFRNIGNCVKDTIEFRIPNGTIDPDTWIENINLYGGIVQAAEILSLIEKKLERGIELTNEETKKLKAFQTIKTVENKQIYEEEKLKALMDLVIQPDEQYIYLKRYKENNGLLMSKNIVGDVKLLNITRKGLGKLAFYGQERVIGSEYLKASQIITKHLQQEKEDKIDCKGRDDK